MSPTVCSNPAVSGGAGDVDADDDDDESATADDGCDVPSGVAAFESGVAGTSKVTERDGVKKAGESVSAIAASLPPRGVVFCGLF